MFPLAIFAEQQLPYLPLIDQCYRASLMRTASLVCAPRTQASCLPSRDQSKAAINLSLKTVTCRGAQPSSGWLQMLAELFLETAQRRTHQSCAARRVT